MRQKSAVVAVLVVALVLLGALVAYGLMRSSRHDGHMMAATEERHEHEREHAHDRGEAGEHHGEPSPSGKLLGGVRVIEMVARQFEFEPATLVVKQGEKVRLEVTSEDVTHGIGIEAYDIDRSLEPGKTEVIEFTADKAGSHHFHCSVYCGSGHGDMHGELIVLERTDQQ